MVILFIWSQSKTKAWQSQQRKSIQDTSKVTPESAGASVVDEAADLVIDGPQLIC